MGIQFESQLAPLAHGPSIRQKKKLVASSASSTKEKILAVNRPKKEPPTKRKRKKHAERRLRLAKRGMTTWLTGGIDGASDIIKIILC